MPHAVPARPGNKRASSPACGAGKPGIASQMRACPRQVVVDAFLGGQEPGGHVQTLAAMGCPSGTGGSSTFSQARDAAVVGSQ